jgi:hypothetical protein
MWLTWATMARLQRNCPCMHSMARSDASKESKLTNPNPFDKPRKMEQEWPHLKMKNKTKQNKTETETSKKANKKTNK